MKKLKTLLAVFGCAFLFPFAFSVTASAISSTHWAIDVADLTLNQGIIEGSRSTFYPDANFTRGQFAYALAKIGGGPTSGTAETGFSDVPSSHKYAAPIKWCKDRGMIYGNGDGTFNPGGAVIREHACAFVYRYCNNRNVPLTPYERNMITFTDQSSITSNMLPGITALYRVNMISGDGNGKFRPKSNITKAEAATLLANLDCREYNNDSTICVYVKDESGKAVVSGAVYVVPSDSSSKFAYTPVLSKGSAPQKGIARYEGLDKNQTYGIDVYIKSTMVTIQDLKKPSRKYVFAVIPSSKSRATDIPFSGYNRGHWGHVDGQCPEGTWAYNDDFCPTNQRRRDQNFGWRYGVNNQREFHQGLDFSCTLTTVKSIAGQEATVTDVGKNADSPYGRYVQMQAGGVFFTYQHLDRIESWVEEGVKVAKDQAFAVSGNTGWGTGYHLHITVATIKDLAPSLTAASDKKRNNYMDPRIYID